MRSIVSPPALRPSAHGLLENANVISPGDEGWYDGLTFTPQGCDAVFAHVSGCWTPRGNKSLQQCKAAALFVPYALETSLVWPTIDMGVTPDPKARITETMQMGTSSVLERLMELDLVDTADITEITVPAASGTTASGGIVGRALVAGDINPKLSDGLDLGFAGATPLIALAALESKLIDASDHTGSAGTIYVKPLYVPFIRDGIQEVNGQYVTIATGSRVVVGNFGADAIYGHVGEVDVYLGPIEVNDTVTHAGNEYIVQAERVAVAVWNPCAVYKQTVDNAALLALYGVV